MKAITQYVLAGILISAGLVGCQATGSTYMNTAQSVNPMQKTYQCDNGKVVTATYDNSDAANPSVVLVIDGASYRLARVVAASGARYASEQGLVAGQGLEWHTKGTSALASSLSVDRAGSSDQAKVLFSCTEKVS